MAGFNSIFAVSSISVAMKYHTEFKRQLAQQNRQFTVATIFSYAANEDDPDDVLGEEGFDATTLNTLWVDKNLKMHGLIQAYSRTKFGDKTPMVSYCSEALRRMTTADIPGYVDLIAKLESKFHLDAEIVGEQVEKYYDGNCEDKEILSTMIRKAVDASIQLRSKKKLIEQFISQIYVESSVQGDWRQYVSEQEESDLAEIIATEKFKPEESGQKRNRVFVLYQM